MPLITQTVKGNEYCYYFNIIRFKNTSIPISTFIGRKDLDPEEFRQKRFLALPKHFEKMKSLVLGERIRKYHFENLPTQDNVESVELFSAQYIVLRSELTKEEEKEFERVLFTKYVYGTTAIEGNNYTEEETERLLVDGLVSKNRTKDETKAINNYHKVRKFVRNYNSTLISEQFIKNIHVLLMKGLEIKRGRSIEAGKYREDNAELKDVAFNSCLPEVIEDRMKYVVLDYYDGMNRGVHPVELASIFHQKFEEIHPFSDGNGRTGREILSFMLKVGGFPEIYIPPAERELYLAALKAGNNSNYVPLIDFLIHRMFRTFVYFMSKTQQLLKGTMSTEFKEYVESSEGGKDVYSEFYELIADYSKSGRLP